MPEYVEPPGARYNDYIGVGAIEDSLVNTSLNLKELAGLNDGDWTIVGIEADAYSHGDPPRWTIGVYALNRREYNVTSFEDWQKLQAERGALPVKHILLHDVDFETLVRTTKGVHLQFLNPNVTKLEIVERGDHPPQD
ncbi:hypothetical protein [Nocardia ignorata]|uniref:Uncharacterized protein n=1 Tax=Nocardia ignorata TaxID=145285 RepID=A0A4R6NYM2_NOCIG|nr:hypothetical protein [Nocardia ignorata]TDP29860.1 hypothetical protein DFR75_112129 [Nocardia ignorata]